MEPAVAITQRVAWGATGRRWRRRSVSARSRFSLRALHGRQDATTFSQLCSPPRERGIDVVDVLRRAAAVLAALAVAGEHGPARERHAGPVRDPHEVGQPDHRRHREAQALGVELGVVARDDDGLLLQDQHHRPPNRDDAQRLEAGVEHQRSSQASRPPRIIAGGDSRRVAGTQGSIRPLHQRR